MRIYIGDNVLVRLSLNEKGKTLSAKINLPNEMVEFSRIIGEELLDIGDPEYNHLFDAVVRCSDNGRNIELVLSKHGEGYMSEKFFQWYFPRLIGALFSKGEVSGRVVGAYVLWEILVLADGVKKKVRIELEDQVEASLLHNFQYRGDTKILEVDIARFTNILPKNRHLFALITMPDENGCYEYYDFINGLWLRDCLSLPPLPWIKDDSTVIYVIDNNKKRIVEVNLRTFSKYLQELLGRLKKTVREEGEFKPITRTVEIIESYMKKGLEKTIYGIMWKLVDLRDYLREYGIKLDDRSSYLLKRLLEIRDLLLNANLSWGEFGIQFIAREVARRIREIKNLEEPKEDEELI
ncbi:MAG: hypothetical protein ACP6IP_00180 [Candidatus Njordarchaeia archaeon]